MPAARKKKIAPKPAKTAKPAAQTKAAKPTKAKPAAKRSKPVRTAKPVPKPRTSKASKPAFPPLDLSSFPPETAHASERWLCLACVTDIFLHQLNLSRT